ncbi:protein hrmA [Aspergillus affinis]|uniref:protein hrmA n=1 Tax=Aspergillus affinis TaxID=1070780 RepID=UPI0022FDEB69|nr:uncharacterized protein KD926_011337 [Aspergillus affinis]KAI9038099.1 hypothetical protein KD926_011337 [Aspergillus affinis]
MASTIWSRIYSTKQEFNKRQTIPGRYLTTLEERLAIVCKPLDRLQRGKERRTMQESRFMSTLRRAKKTYVDILHEDPDIFIPFILNVSEYACRSFDVTEFCQQHKRGSRISLNMDAKEILASIATRNNISMEPNYRKLENYLFPQPRPVTLADSHGHWGYLAASWEATYKLLGDQICHAIELSPARLSERVPSTTDCVRMRFPRENFQDVYLMLNVGLHYDIINTLFPHAGRKLVSNLQADPPVSHDWSNTHASTQPECFDNAHFTILGASVTGISLIFCPEICAAIEKSNLRAWEKENLLSDTTDCVTMEAYRGKPHYGIICGNDGCVVYLVADVANYLRYLAY